MIGLKTCNKLIHHFPIFQHILRSTGCTKKHNVFTAACTALRFSPLVITHTTKTLHSRSTYRENTSRLFAFLGNENLPKNELFAWIRNRGAFLHLYTSLWLFSLWILCGFFCLPSLYYTPNCFFVLHLLFHSTRFLLSLVGGRFYFFCFVFMSGKGVYLYECFSWACFFEITCI